MLQHTTIQFLKDLKANNNRDWFAKHKSDFEMAKADILELTGQLIDGIKAFDPSIGELEPKKCMFRIYRDVRFSKNKDPYKTNLGAYIVKGGKKSGNGGYYLHIEPGGCFFGGGMYGPPSPLLKKIRQEIDYNEEEFRGIIGHTNFKIHFGDLQGSQLKSAPKGYPKDHQAIDLLRYKDFLAVENITEKALTTKGFVEKALTSFEAMMPLIHFLNRCNE